MLHVMEQRNDVAVSSAEAATGAALLFRSGLAFEHRHLNLIRKTGQMASQPIKQIALGLVDRKIPDQGALSGISAKLFELGLIVLHRQRPFPCCDEFRRRNKQSQFT